MSAVTSQSAASDDDENPGEGPSEREFLASLPRRLRIVNARSSLSRDALPARVECGDDPELGSIAQAVWDAEKGSARALASRYRALAALFAQEGSSDHGEGTAADDVDTLRAACALRVTHGAARWELRNAHRAVEQHPHSLALLETGDFPSWWFQRMLRAGEDLTEHSRRLLDAAVGAWSTDIPAERFITLLNALVDLLARREKEPPPPPQREVTLAPGSSAGTGSVTAAGPIPEILGYWKRLDETARALQAAQRKALREGTEIPYDVDQLVSTTGHPVPLARLRYELQLNATFDTDGVHVPQQRFRLNLTVPALTALGVSDAPGMLEGTIPVPPEMARELSGREDTWYRILTEPCSGAFLPLPADRYHPSPAMLEHLRLRNSTCAVPGCTRPSSWASEADHIEEYDHEHRESGGLTEIENLHLLCWAHHQDKTAGFLDPSRLSSPAREPGRTRWRLGADGDHVTVPDDTDHASLIAVQQLDSAWKRHLAQQRAADARRTEPPPPPPAVSSPRPTDPSPPGAPPIPPATPPGTPPRDLPAPPVPLRPEIPPGPWDPDDPPPF